MKFNPEIHCLGKLCKYGHEFEDSGKSLRQKQEKRCVECRKVYKKIYKQKNNQTIVDGNRKYYSNNKEKIAIRGNIYYSDNKEKIAEVSKIYRLNNKEKIAIRGNIYYSDNKEKIAEGKRKYREKNREKIAEGKRKYQEENKEKIALKSKKYYSENQEKIKKYREENKEKNNAKLRNQSRVLHDNHVRSVIWNSIYRTYGIKPKDITPEMIELKRELMQFKRLEKEINNVINS